MFLTFYFAQVSSLIASRKGLTGKRLDMDDYFVCGAVTGFVASFIEGPIDLVSSEILMLIIQSI